MKTENLTYSPKSTTPYAPLKILSWAAAVWLSVATVGQWIFGVYILLFYGKHTVRGDFEKWNEVLPHGYVAGDWKGNFVVSIHVLLAAVLVIGGPLQLIPKIRTIFPAFHRWLGRTYVVTAIIVSVAGLIMVWTRGAVGDTTQHVSISIQAAYIVSFALLTIRYARARQFDKHRAWALRLFMVANGVWFFRIGLMCWLVVNGGPAGFDTKTFSGPFLTFLAVSTYAIPISLIVLEMYFYSLKKRSRAFSLFTAAIIFILTILMCIGIAGATMGMWLPRFS
jgi:hypothetical protein